MRRLSPFSAQLHHPSVMLSQTCTLSAVDEYPTFIRFCNEHQTLTATHCEVRTCPLTPLFEVSCTSFGCHIRACCCCLEALDMPHEPAGFETADLTLSCPPKFVGSFGHEPDQDAAISPQFSRLPQSVKHFVGVTRRQSVAQILDDQAILSNIVICKAA